MNASLHDMAAGAGLAQAQALRDSAYNNGAAVADSAAITRGWVSRGEAVRRLGGARLGWSYGSAPRQAIDFFPGADDSLPLLVFFHGGYWQTRAKEDFSFVAEGPLAAGFAVAMVGYTLAPDASLPGIVQECRDALAFLRGAFGAPPLMLAGWSAGAHLATSLMDEAGVMATLAISGVYELEPLRHTYLNTALRLDEATAKACSPLNNLPGAHRPLSVAWGGSELPALRSQSERYVHQRLSHGQPTHAMPLAGLHHFSVLDELAAPHGRLTQELLRLARA
ncbi:alpha/beta hydrolase [Hydrogenophaga laconesensis]|uniref:Arylformamidase n=1 Tax=Hydrogenophaga laconesensis TaxID=1805971 RepID=A0ABU1V995_9BURK|nr:alpha/beta hydrolase [Hydrogenophaga laconesensis]MDR7094039.1 arylformamidase [Hydrogenophaga laconesensis]